MNNNPATVHDLCISLLSDFGWYLLPDFGIAHKYSTNDYKDLEDNIENGMSKPIIIPVHVNNNGEYESSIEQHKNKAVLINYYIEANDFILFGYNTVAKPFITALDPSGNDLYRIFSSFNENDGYICISRVIALPADDTGVQISNDYINKSAEIHFMVFSAMDLLLNTIGDDSAFFLLDGAQIDNSIEWFEKYLFKMHEMHSEYVYRYQKEDKSLKEKLEDVSDSVWDEICQEAFRIEQESWENPPELVNFKSTFAWCRKQSPEDLEAARQVDNQYDPECLGRMQQSLHVYLERITVHTREMKLLADYILQYRL